MKTFVTPNLLKFSLVSFLFAVAFRLGLSWSIENKMIVPLVLSASLYGVAMWFSGMFFGKKENDYLPIFDIGFRFHGATFIIHNIVSLIWFWLGFNSHFEKIEVVYYTAVIWLILFIPHLIYFLVTRKSTINNLSKKDLFE